MRFFVTVKTRAREDGIQAVDATHFIASVKAAPVDGKANAAVRRVLARHLGVPVRALVLCAGATGKRKVFDCKTA